jgi:hypothetical protein
MATAATLSAAAPQGRDLSALGRALKGWIQTSQSAATAAEYQPTRSVLKSVIHACTALNFESTAMEVVFQLHHNRESRNFLHHSFLPNPSIYLSTADTTTSGLLANQYHHEMKENPPRYFFN